MGETCSTHWQYKFFSLRFKNYLMAYVVHCNRKERFLFRNVILQSRRRIERRILFHYAGVGGMPIMLFSFLKTADMEGKYVQNTWLKTKEKKTAFKETVGFTKPKDLRSLGAVLIRLDVREDGGGNHTRKLGI